MATFSLLYFAFYGTATRFENWWFLLFDWNHDEKVMLALLLKIKLHHCF